MSTVKMKMTTNARLVGDVLPSKRNTFYALKELINNSIKAGAKNIHIDLIPSDCDENSLMYHKIDKIVVADDGKGVPESQFANRIMEIATESEGNGTGRFAGLLIGKEMAIETTSFDSEKGKKTSTGVVYKAKDLLGGKIDDIEFDVSFDDVNKNTSNGFKVTLSELYHYDSQCPKKNQLSSEFKEDQFAQSIFEHYPFYIFNSKVQFVVNGEKLKKENFCLGKPKNKVAKYIDTLGDEHKVLFQFYSLKLTDKRVRIFLQSTAGFKTNIAEFVYNSIWYSPEAMGAQFVVVESDLITPDLYADFSVEAFGQGEWVRFSKLIRETIDEFYKEGDVKYKTFLKKLGADDNYPYRPEERNKLYSETIFERSAYLFDDELDLFSKDSKTRKIIYLLLRNAIENGDMSFLFSNVLNISKDGQNKLQELLRQTEMEEIIRFSAEVAQKDSYLNFLNDLVYGVNAKQLLERKQLHKIVERHLWVFGEEYNDTLKLWSDTSLENNLNELHDKYLNYQPTKNDENLIEDIKGKVKSITDLFFYNEKKLGNGRREVMIVELKAPKCAIGQKELNQVERYAFEIAQQAKFPKHDICYKILLISSRITDFGRSAVDSSGLNQATPFLYKLITNNSSDIQIFVMEWSELINKNKMRLSYLGNKLKLKYDDVNEVFQKEYSELMIPNRNPRLYESKK